MIDETKTFKLFGYTSDSLSKGSHKRVVRVCDECKNEKMLDYSSYMRSKSGDLCITCSNKCRMNLTKLPIISEQDRFIEGTGIDRIKTIEKFGYDPIELSNGSQYKVWSICQECGKGREIFNHPYHPYCNSCAKKGNRNPAYGISPTDYQKSCVSKALTGITRTDIERQKVSATKQGIPYDKWIEYCSRDHIDMECKCIKLNSRFPNSEGHHLSRCIIIYIPKELHRHLYHNLKTGRNMKEINTLALQYLNGEI